MCQCQCDGKYDDDKIMSDVTEKLMSAYDVVWCSDCLQVNYYHFCIIKIRDKVRLKWKPKALSFIILLVRNFPTKKIL